jgi:hypothetical protein
MCVLMQLHLASQWNAFWEIIRWFCHCASSQRALHKSTWCGLVLSVASFSIQQAR